ncbi:MAG: hypothetical protein P0120_02105 [Nitrospira sp.]|nr:hypothetical protein [Nitrospira sp.]
MRAFFADIAVRELTQAIKNHSVDLRKRYGLKLPDAIVAATALLTNDQRLLALTEVPTQMLPIKVLS